VGSLSLRPGDSLTVPRTALSVGFIRFVSFTNATQATGFRLFPRWDLSPTEHASLRWSHSISEIRFRAKINDLRGGLAIRYLYVKNVPGQIPNELNFLAILGCGIFWRDSTCNAV